MSTTARLSDSAAAPSNRLVILNLAEARFECTFGRGCDGVCCRDGRPPIYADEIQRIDAVLPQILREMRPKARRYAEKHGYLSRRIKAGALQARVVAGWCIFFNGGCVLHKIGAPSGDPFRYKPAVCAVFPLEHDSGYRWYVRQKEYRRERWNLPCLDPASTAVPAAASLREEIALAEKLTTEKAGRKAEA